MTAAEAPFVAVENLRVTFPGTQGATHAVRGVSFSMTRERLGIVGESGSGKSVTGRSLMRLLPPKAQVSADVMTVAGHDIARSSDAEVRALRGSTVGLILQDPKFSLNPVKTVGQLIGETWRAHHGGCAKEARAQTLEALAQVQIRDPMRVLQAYPHELSGGMGQRVMIALMLAAGPELLIADEPTSALDSSVQTEVLRLLDDLVQKRGMGLILISHDLPLVSRFCDRVLVMYAGRIVEQLMARDLAHARHPYTRGLLNCLPRLGEKRTTLPALDRDPAWLDEAAP